MPLNDRQIQDAIIELFKLIGASHLPTELQQISTAPDKQHFLHIQKGTADGQRINVEQLRGFFGSYDPTTDSPALSNATGTEGTYYLVSKDGSRDFGNGIVNMSAGDTIEFKGGSWGVASDGASLASKLAKKLNKRQLGSGYVNTALANPTAPTVTNVGTAGATLHTYYVVAEDDMGGMTEVSPAGSTSTGNATLDTTNYNAISWAPIEGAVRYHVLKGDTGSLLETTTETSFADTGQGTTAFTAPTRNNTADIVIDGKFIKSDSSDQYLLLGGGGTKLVGDFILSVEKGAANGVATLNSNGVLDPSQINEIAITSVRVAAENTFAGFLTNSGSYTYEEGDVIVIVDANGLKTHYIYAGGDKTLEASYSEITGGEILISQVKGLQAALDGKENAFTKNSAFNKSFGTTAGTVAEGNHGHSADAITETTSRVWVSPTEKEKWNKEPQQLTGTTFDLSNVDGNSYNYGAPSTALSYLTTNPVVKGYSSGLINAGSEPVVYETDGSTPATKITGATFTANTNMELVVESQDGVNIRYFFLAL